MRRLVVLLLALVSGFNLAVPACLAAASAMEQPCLHQMAPGHGADCLEMQDADPPGPVDESVGPAALPMPARSTAVALLLARQLAGPSRQPADPVATGPPPILEFSHLRL